MKFLFRADVEDIYMNFSQNLTFDQSFDTQIVDQLGDATYIIDESNGRTTWTLEFENCTITGHLQSSRCLVKSLMKHSAPSVNDFIAKVEAL